MFIVFVCHSGTCCFCAFWCDNFAWEVSFGECDRWIADLLLWLQSDLLAWLPTLQISLNFSDFSIEPGCSDMHWYFLLFEKLTLTKKENRKGKSRMGPILDPSFSNWTWIFWGSMLRASFCWQEKSQDIHISKNWWYHPKKGKKEKKILRFSFKYKDYAFISES